MDIIIRNLLTEKLSVFYEVDSQIAAALCATGLASPHVKMAAIAAIPTEIRWFVQRLQNSGTLAITCQRPGGEVVSFTQPRAGLRYCDSVCPDAVLMEFAAKSGLPEVSGNWEAVKAAETQKQRR